MELQDYINNKYDGNRFWFIEEVNQIRNQNRVNDLMAKKEYLNGDHAILHKPTYKYKEKEFVPRKIVLNYAKTLLDFQKNYLLSTPNTLTGNEDVVREMQKVQRKGKYHRINLKILDKILKYGQVAEYVYLRDGIIKSKVIDSSEGYPVYDNENELISFVESYTSDAITYYVVYTADTVAKYNNEGGEVRLIEQRANLSGLPIVYTSDNELDDTEGKSELDDWISILDQMEDLVSKYMDSFYKFIDPIPVVSGRQIKGDGINPDIVGGGLSLDDGSTFDLHTGQLDSKTFESIYKTLLQSLLDTSQTPAVSMNKTDISNLSEVSIKLLFSLANIRAANNEQYLKDGLEQRYDKIRQLLELQGTVFNDEDYYTLDFVFQYAMPSNDKEIIENIKDLREMGAISLESILDNSPFTNDVQMELGKIMSENDSQSDADDNNGTDNDDVN